MKFRKKDKEIDAERYVGKAVRGVCTDDCFDHESLAGTPHVHTIHEGQICTVQPGDWIIPEPDGEHFYPVKNEIFEATYEKV